jgi:hypothetical protein
MRGDGGSDGRGGERGRGGYGPFAISLANGGEGIEGAAEGKASDVVGHRH